MDSIIDRVRSPLRLPLKSSDEFNSSSEKWLELSLASAKISAYKWDLRTNIVQRSRTSPGFANLDAAQDSLTYLESLQNIHPDDRARVEELVAEAIRTKTQFDIEFRALVGDKVCWFQSRGQAIYDAAGEPCEVLSVASDISHVKENEAKLKSQAEQLELAKHQLRLALDSAGMFAIAGIKAGASFQSPELCRLLGVQDENMWLSPESIAEYFHPDDRAPMAEKIAQGISGAPSDYEFRIRQTDGSFRWFSLKGSHQLEKEGRDVSRKAYLVVQDITDRKQAEAAVLKKSSELAAINERLERFSSIVAHDLKGPLNTISMAADLTAEANSLEKAQDVSRFIKRGVARMTELIDNLLNFAKSESSTSVIKEEVLIQDLIDAVESNLRAAFSQSGATLKIAGELPKLMGYPTQLLQLFQNLIGNAIKFRASQKLQVCLSVVDRSDHWEFGIADNGRGIDVDDQEKIFAPFERADSGVSDGSGLGLSICKRIVELHGGRIWVESEKGRGAKFCFTIAKSF